MFRFEIVCIHFFWRRTSMLIVPLILALSLPISQAVGDTSEPRIFLTFDDGPIDASLNVLDTLKANGVKATFFLNGFRLKTQGGEKHDHAREALRRMIREGHVIGNHSYDHMRHNSVFENKDYPVDSYRDLEADSTYFSPLNIATIVDALGILSKRSNNAIASIGRMPFSNNWVLPGLSVVCACCTGDGVPPWSPLSKCGTVEQPFSNSARIAGDIAAVLFREHGMAFYGWDVEWGPSNWDAQRVSETLAPEEAIEKEVVEAFNGKGCTIRKLSSEVSCDSPVIQNKVIVLTHDYFFENSWRGRGADINLPKLDKLIKTLKRSGYQFDTLDHYLK